MDKSSYKFGLIGQNIGYSASPTIHKEILASKGLVARYDIIETTPEELDSLLESLERSGTYIGLNVTSPFKKRVATYTNSALSSVNTLYRDKTGKYAGTSTDALGFIDALSEFSYNLSDFSQVLIVGGGGAACSLIESKIFNSLPVKVFSRSLFDTSRYSTTPDNLRSYKLTEFHEHLSSESTLVIQSTSAPHKNEDLSFVGPNLLRLNGLFYDLCYNPPCDAGKYLSPNAKFIDGRRMLYFQALRSYDYWL